MCSRQKVTYVVMLMVEILRRIEGPTWFQENTANCFKMYWWNIPHPQIQDCHKPHIAKFYRRFPVVFTNLLQCHQTQRSYLVRNDYMFRPKRPPKGQHYKNFKIRYNTERVIICTVLYNVGRDSSVGIATRYGMDGPGIEFR